MDIKTIGVEDWLNVWEKSATYDIAQSTIASMTMGEILQLDGCAGATFYDLPETARARRRICSIAPRSTGLHPADQRHHRREFEACCSPWASS